ncbi:MAG: AraC family transcriptional regulator [bacterium]|nr:AraC family transcriptional regulator [bacterium]
MDWIELVKNTLSYIELNLLEPITAEEIGQELNISGFYLQNGFKVMTGYGIGEYIRNRRLYMAALDVLKGDEKIIDLSEKYRYETPESFSKAFRRFHGVSPMQMRTRCYKVKPFLPIELTVSLKGGSKLSVTIEKMHAWKVIGLPYTVCYDSAFDCIPGYWDNYCKNILPKVNQQLPGCCIGMYGICMEQEENKKDFVYLIAGDYHGEEVPEGFSVVEIPAYTWAKFHCTGPMPSALQSMNRRIYEEWLPSHPEYTIAGGYNVELYDNGDTLADTYQSHIWLPIKEV